MLDTTSYTQTKMSQITYKQLGVIEICNEMSSDKILRFFCSTLSVSQETLIIGHNFDSFA